MRYGQGFVAEPTEREEKADADGVKEDGALIEKQRHEKRVAMVMRRAEQEKKHKDREAHQIERQFRASRALDKLQPLAYCVARGDVDHDHPDGIAVLDSVFEVIRQVCDLPPASKVPPSEGGGSW